MQDFFTGGSGTVSKTLAFCIYYLAHHPEYQVQIIMKIIKTKLQSQCPEEFAWIEIGTILVALILRILFPTKCVQDMARTEILAAASCSEENELVSLEQRDLIPFTEACLLESQRMGSVLPISPPRLAGVKPFHFYYL